SWGPDGAPGNQDDLVAARPLLPAAVAPVDVRARSGVSPRVFSGVPLAHVALAQVTNSLRPMLTDPAGAMKGLTIGAFGDSALALLGPPEQVAYVIDHV